MSLFVLLSVHVCVYVMMPSSEICMGTAIIRDHWNVHAGLIFAQLSVLVILELHTYV